VAFHAPELISAEEREQYQAWLQERWSASDFPETEWMTVGKARRALNEMSANDQVDRSLIGIIAIYLYRFERPAGAVGDGLLIVTEN